MAHEFVRFVPPLGMFAFSRSRATCRWQTDWCSRKCYAKKFYKLRWAKDEYDQLDDDWWIANDWIRISEEIRRVASTGPTPPSRFRFSVKGEIWNHPTDVVKVQGVLKALPSTLFWIPTRAWHCPEMEKCIRDYVMIFDNARVLASIDPCVSAHELDYLRSKGWSIVFAGDNERGQMQLSAAGAEPNLTDGMHSCAKTWEHREGHCATCEDGCFMAGHKEVHLKEHL